jgi:hypothetical protein
MTSLWADDPSTKLGAFRVARDPSPASPAIKAAIAKVAKRGARETEAIKQKRPAARAARRRAR